MTPTSTAACRVFISYAHKDGTALANRLQADLTKTGFTAWLDTQRLLGGDIWSREIEQAIDDAEIVIALLSDGSHISEVCRGEQLRSLRKGKCVIPLKVQADCDIPIYLEAKQWLGFSSSKSYDQDRLKLIAAMEKREGALLKPEYRTTYNNAPGLLENLVRRPEVLTALRKQLFTQGTNRNIALTALRGMGGIGKTVLAQELCHDDVVQQAFPDGIFWFTIGQETKLDFVSRVRQVPALDRLLGEYQGEEACKSQYRDVLQKKAALIVLDDVWSASDVRPFYAESPRSRLLFTTREASIATSFAAAEFQAELLTEDQSRKVLKQWSGWQSETLPDAAASIIHECGRLPLALSMIGASLHGEPASSWNGVADRLSHADLSLIEGDVGAYQHVSFLRAIQVSIEALEKKSPRDKECYLSLAILLEELEAPVEILSARWGLNEFEARRVAKRLVDSSLAQRETPERGLRLHDLQLDYLRKLYVDQEALSFILEGMRLSFHVYGRDSAQFASQLTGRLLPYRDNPAIARFFAQIAKGTQTAWLRPLKSTLHPPGTCLRATLAGHMNDVTAVALSKDGRLAVSASRDKTLRVWDLVRGRELHILTGHADSVNAVALTADGQLVVSASSDKTLKVWEVSSGSVLHTLTGHADSVNAVALTADGQLAVSASSDKTLKVWEVSSGSMLHTLTGHADSVNAVALTKDGRRAVSAADDKTLRVWNVQTGVAIRTLIGHAYEVTSVAVTPNGRYAVSTGEYNKLKVWDLEKGVSLRTLSGHTYWVRSVAVTADGRALSASDDRTLKLWDLKVGGTDPTAANHMSKITGVAVTLDGRHAISASVDRTLKVWDLQTWAEVQILSGHANGVNGVAMVPDNRHAVSASDDGTLIVWDIETGTEVRTLSGGTRPVFDRTDPVRQVSVTPDGRAAVSASWHELKLWDLRTGAKLRTLTARSEIYCVAVTPDGCRALYGSWQELGVWDLETGAKLSTRISNTRVTHVAVTPDGRRAVCASEDWTIKVWDIERWAEVHLLSRKAYGINGVAVSPDSRHGISSSDDHELKLWNLETGSCLASFTCDGPIYCCAFCNDHQIIAGDGAGRIHLLRLEQPRPER